MNLSTWVLDHYDMLANGQVSRESLEKIASSMRSRLMSPEEISRQTDDDFGIVLIASGGTKIRRFPLKNSFESFMSKTASVMNGQALPEGARNILTERIDASLNRFRVPVQGLIKRATVATTPNIYVMTRRDEGQIELKEEMSKTASMNKYAINEALDGTPMQRFPIVTSDQVKRRINGFESQAKNLHIKYAFQYADNVANRADELGVNVPKDSKLFLFKTAALSPHFKHYVNARIKHAPDELQGAYIGLMLKSASADPRALAVALDSLDRSCGMDMLYGKAFPCAAESSLSTVKKAESIQVGTTVVDVEDIRRAIENAPEDFAAILDGNEAVERMKEDPKAVFESLPLAYRQSVLQLLDRL